MQMPFTRTRAALGFLVALTLATPALAELRSLPVADGVWAIRMEALDVIRGLIDRVIVFEAEDGTITVELNGAIASMIETAQPGALKSINTCYAKVVAGVGFEPTTFRL